MITLFLAALFIAAPVRAADIPAVAEAQAAAKSGDYDSTAALLSAVDETKLPASERDTWAEQARFIAVRAGDKRLLLRARPTDSGDSVKRHNFVVNATDFLQAGDTQASQDFLRRAGNPATLPPADRYRWYVVSAAIARLERLAPVEQTYLLCVLEIVESNATETVPNTAPKRDTSVITPDWWLIKRLAALPLLPVERRSVDARIAQVTGRTVPFSVAAYP